MRGLGADRDLRIAQDEVGKLGEAVQSNRIGAVDLDVLFDGGQLFADVVHIYWAAASLNDRGLPG